MRRSLTAFAAAATIALAGPAFAFDLPNLTFPKTPPPVVTQDCSDIATTTDCKPSK